MAEWEPGVTEWRPKRPKESTPSRAELEGLTSEEVTMLPWDWESVTQQEPPEVTVDPMDPAQWDAWIQEHEYALRTGVKDDGRLPWWAYDEVPPPEAEPEELQQIDAVVKVPDLTTEDVVEQPPEEVEEPKWWRKAIDFTLDALGHPGATLAGAMRKGVSGVIELADKYSRGLTRGYGMVMRQAEKYPVAYQGILTAALASQSGATIPTEVLRPERIQEEMDAESAAFAKFVEQAVREDPALEEKLQAAGIGKLTEVKLAFQKAWQEAEGYRFTHSINQNARALYNALVSGTARELGYKLPDGSDPEDRKYAPEEAAALTENPWIELGMLTLLDPLNYADPIGPVLSKGVGAALKPLKWLGGATFDAATKIPKAGKLLLFAVEDSPRSKANQMYNAVYDIVRYVSNKLPGESTENILRIIADESHEFWRYADDYVRSMADDARRFISEADIPFSADMPVEDVARDLAEYAFSKTMAELRAEGFDKLPKAARIVQLLGDQYANTRVARAITKTETFLKRTWLGTRPAWSHNNLRDNWFKLILNGVNPMQRIDKVMSLYERKFGPVPLEAFGTFAKGTAGKVSEWAIGERKFTTPLGEIARAFWDKRSWNVPKWLIEGHFNVGAAIEEGSRLRLYLNKFEEAAHRGWLDLVAGIRNRRLNPRVRQLIERELRMKGAWTSPEELADILRKYADEEVRFYTLGEIDPTDIPAVDESTVSAIYSELQRLQQSGRIAKVDVERVFEGYIDEVVNAMNAEYQRRVKSLQSVLDVPKSPDKLVRRVLDYYIPEGAKPTVELLKRSFDDIHAYRVQLELRSEELLAEHLDNLKELYKSGASLNDIRKAWRNYKRRANRLWARGNAFLNESRKKWAQEVKRRYGIEIPEEYLDRLSELEKQIHEKMKETWKLGDAAARRALYATSLERKTRIWETFRMLKSSLQGELTRFQGEADRIRYELKLWLENEANLPLGVRPADGSDLAGLWEVPVQDVRNIGVEIDAQYGPILNQLKAWKDHTLSQLGKPVEVVRLTKDEINNILAEADDIVRTWTNTLGEAKQYGIDETNRLLVDYMRTNNIQELIGHIVPFWRWPAANIPIYARLMLEHPYVPSHVIRYRLAKEKANEDLPSRLRDMVPFPGGQKYMELMGVKDSTMLYFDPMTFISILSQIPGWSYYEQRRLQELEKTDKDVQALYELLPQAGFGMWPWWEWMAGLSGVAGDDFYPRNIFPWSVAVEQLTYDMGLTHWDPRYKIERGFNPDNWLRSNLSDLLHKLGVMDAAFVEDKFLEYYMGREARGLIAAGEEPTTQLLYENALRKQFAMTLFGHLTGFYVKELSPLEVKERKLRYERKKLADSMPPGPEFRETMQQWYDAHPEYSKIQQTWDRFPWVETVDEWEAKQRQAEIQERRHAYYEELNRLNASYEQMLNDYLKNNPYDKHGLRRIRNEWYQAKRELQQRYADLPVRFSPWGKTPQEIEQEHRDEALRHVIDMLYPEYSDYVQEDGSVNWDQYMKDLDKFYELLPQVAFQLPEVGEMVSYLQTEFGMTEEEAKEFLRPYFNKESVERYFMENDTIQEALLKAYEETYLGRAEEEYAEEIKPKLKELEEKYADDPRKLSQEKSKLMEAFFNKYPEVEAKELEDAVMTLYPGKWSRLELAQATEGLVFPGVKDAWFLRRKGRDRIVSRINDLYYSLPSPNRKKVREALGEQFEKFFVNKETRDIDAISTEQLGKWMNALEVAVGQQPSDWRKWPGIADDDEADADAVQDPTDETAPIWEIIPKPFQGRPGQMAAMLLADVDDPAELVEAWRKASVIQRRAIELVHPGMEEAMKELGQKYAPDMGQEARQRFNEYAHRYGVVQSELEAGDIQVDEDLPEIKLYSPEEVKEYEAAVKLNEEYWNLREQGRDEEAKQIAKNPIWRKWFGNTPKALFWQTYFETVPPGWRSKEIREHPAVAAILNKGIRAYVSEEAYADALEAIQEWALTSPDVGDPKEWEQAKREMQEYLRIKETEGKEAARAYADAHPLVKKYFWDPRYTRTSKSGGRRVKRGTGGGGGGKRFSGKQLWSDLKKELGDTVHVLVGEIIEYLGPNKRALSADARKLLEALYGKYGAGMSFDDFLRLLVTMWRRYGSSYSLKVRAPKAPNTESRGSRTLTRWRVSF